MTPIARSIAAALVAAVAALGAPAAAEGATAVSADGGVLTIAGGPEVNTVEINVCCGGRVQVEDAAAGATAGANCNQVSATLVECPQVPTANASLGDGEDRWEHEAGTDPLATQNVDMGPGDDTFVSSAAQNVDNVTGGPGRDSLNANGGDDTVRGGPGDDTVLGGSENDRVFGDDGDDTVRGQHHDDTVEGGSGRDVVNGDSASATVLDGSDRIAVRDGEVDQVTCGFGADAVSADGGDLIEMADCESVDRGATSQPPAPPPGAGGDRTRPVLAGLVVAGGTIRYRLSEAATVTFGVERAAPGRRVGGRCLRPARANRARPRCTRYVPVPGRFTHRGRAGANSLPFPARLAGRRLAPGRYRLVAVARDAAGNRSAPRRTAFRVGRRTA